MVTPNQNCRGQSPEEIIEQNQWVNWNDVPK